MYIGSRWVGSINVLGLDMTLYQRIHLVIRNRFYVAHISDKKYNDVIANCCGDPCPSIRHIQLHGNWCSRGCSGSLECSNIRHLTSDDGKSGKLYLNSFYLRTGKKHVKFDVNEGNFAAVMRVTTVSIL